MQSEAGPENAARERSRVRTLRQAFLALQAALPAVPPNTKLSKLDVLVLATSYIAYLTRTLGHELPGPAWPPFLRGLRYLHPLKVGHEPRALGSGVWAGMDVGFPALSRADMRTGCFLLSQTERLALGTGLTLGAVGVVTQNDFMKMRFLQGREIHRGPKTLGCLVAEKEKEQFLRLGPGKGNHTGRVLDPRAHHPIIVQCLSVLWTSAIGGIPALGEQGLRRPHLRRNQAGVGEGPAVGALDHACVGCFLHAPLPRPGPTFPEPHLFHMYKKR